MKTEKIEGAKMVCKQCGSTLICRRKEYQGNVTLQWQNEEGGAHYQYSNGNYSCNISEQKPQASNSNNNEIFEMLRAIDAICIEIQKTTDLIFQTVTDLKIDKDK